MTKFVYSVEYVWYYVGTGYGSTHTRMFMHYLKVAKFIKALELNAEEEQRGLNYRIYVGKNNGPFDDIKFRRIN